MKLLFLTIILPFCLFIGNVSGQETNSSFLQQLSLEAGTGYHLPFSPNKGIITSEYGGFRSFYVGVTNAINDVLGVRITYANNTFMSIHDKSNKFTIQKLMVETTFNILQSIQSIQKDTLLCIQL